MAVEWANQVTELKVTFQVYFLFHYFFYYLVFGVHTAIFGLSMQSVIYLFFILSYISEHSTYNVFS